MQHELPNSMASIAFSQHFLFVEYICEIAVFRMIPQMQMF